MRDIVDHILKPVGKFILASCLAIIICNIIVSVFIYNDRGLSRNLDLGVRYKPNNIIVNGTEGFAINKFDNLGFNNDFIEFKKNKYRIIVLGDSHTEATQVKRQQNFCTKLSCKLGVQKIEVINLGISGNSIAEYIFFADKYLGVFKPDYVILQFTYQDFLKDSTSTDKVIYIKKDNHEFSLIQNTKILNSKIKIIKDKYFKYFPIFSFLYNVKINQIFSCGSERQHEIKTSNESIDKDLINWELDMLRKKFGDKLVLLNLPYTPNIKNGQIFLEETGYELSATEYIKREANTLCIDVVDMKDSFIKLYKSSNRFPRGFSNTMPGIGHLNNTGHELVAQSLHSYFIKKGI